MYSLLESKAEIASAQRKLEAAIRQSFKGKATTNIGYPGGPSATPRSSPMAATGSGRPTIRRARHPTLAG